MTINVVMEWASWCRIHPTFHLIEQKWEHFITKRLDKTFWEPCFKTAVMSCFFLRLHKLLDKLLCQGFVYTNGLTSVLLNLHLRKTLFAQSAKNVNIAEATVTYLVIYSNNKWTKIFWKLSMKKHSFSQKITKSFKQRIF